MSTSAYDVLLGEIRSTPRLRADLEGAIEEACAVGQAEGAHEIDPAKAIGELEAAHDTLGSSMQRDIAAGREPELDAIPGAVLRAGARHGIDARRSNGWSARSPHGSTSSSPGTGSFARGALAVVAQHLQ